uniref:Uncharacterized protein n=1 Tax=Glossina pallidipes TaxID=7398 RepID=A0A1B0AFR7_GLOPL
MKNNCEVRMFRDRGGAHTIICTELPRLEVAGLVTCTFSKTQLSKYNIQTLLDSNIGTRRIRSNA